MTAPARVVSLLASGTEIVAALGCADRLVAISHECDHPAEILDRPRVTTPTFDVAAPGYQIDETVKRLVQEGLSLYRVDGAALRALKPDLIVTQTQCAVCAVTPADLQAATADWLGAEVPIVSLSPERLDGVFADIARLADALGVPARGADLVSSLRDRLASIARRAQAAVRRPRIACLEWLDPLMGGGNWMPELVEIAGGVNLFGEAGKHTPWLDPAAFAASDPDVILAVPCGFPIDRTRAEFDALTTLPRWAGLQAVRAGRVFIADGNAFFNRSGPRLVESAEILAELLHPDRFAFGHEGTGWVRAL